MADTPAVEIGRVTYLMAEPPVSMSFHPRLTVVTGMGPSASAVLLRDLRDIGERNGIPGVVSNMTGHGRGAVHILDPDSAPPPPGLTEGDTMARLFELARIRHALYAEAVDDLLALDSGDLRTRQRERNARVADRDGDGGEAPWPGLRGAAALTALALPLALVGRPLLVAPLLFAALFVIVRQIGHRAGWDRETDELEEALAAARRLGDTDTIRRIELERLEIARAQAPETLPPEDELRWSIPYRPLIERLHIVAPLLTADGASAADDSIFHMAFNLAMLSMNKDNLLIVRALPDCPAAHKGELLDIMSDFRIACQVIVISDDPDVSCWAVQEAPSGTIRVIQPASALAPS